MMLEKCKCYIIMINIKFYYLNSHSMQLSVNNKFVYFLREGNGKN